MSQLKKVVWGIFVLTSGVMMALMASCSNPLEQMSKMSEQQQLTVEPNPLELHGNNVGFTVSAKLPVKMMKKGTKYAINISYASGDPAKFVKGTKISSTAVGSLEFDGDKYAGQTQEPKVTKKLNFAYEDKHETGFLIMTGSISKGSKSKTVGPILVKSNGAMVLGVATTQRLVKNPMDGVSNANGKSPFAYAKHGYTSGGTPETKTVNMNFEKGSSRLNKGTGSNSGTMEVADLFIKAKVPPFKANGASSHSPEGSETVNNNLSDNRGKALQDEFRRLMKLYEYKEIDKYEFNIEAKKLDATWPEFKTEIQNSSLTADQKSEVIAIVDGSEGFVEKEQKLQGLSYYNTMMDEIYPRLRYARVEVTKPSATKTKADMEAALKEIEEGKKDASSLTEEEFLYMVSQNPDYEQRVKWLKKASEKYSTWKVYNNLGAALLDVGLLKKDNSKADEALTALETSKNKKETGEVYYNMGMAYLMKGDEAKAWEAFKKAQEIGDGGNSELASLLAGIQGYFDIKEAGARDDGKYKSAYEGLANATNTNPNHFNKGLAYLLEAQDYEQAKAAFEAAKRLNENDAITYYALAIVASRQGNESDMSAALKKAVELDSKLKAKALKDVEFAKYKTKSSFTDAIK